MFAKLCILAAALPLALGLTIDTPTNVTSGLRSTISWETTAQDEPSFSMELNHPSFRNSLALLNNVNPTTTQSADVEWPIVPADNQYTLMAVNIGNISQVYATSGSFAIAQAPSTGVSASVSTTFTSGASSGASASATSPSGSSTGASTTGASSGSSGSGSSGSSTGAPASSSSTTSFNGSNGAASLKAGNTGLVGLLAVVAGAAALL